MVENLPQAAIVGAKGRWRFLTKRELLAKFSAEEACGNPHRASAAGGLALRNQGSGALDSAASHPVNLAHPLNLRDGASYVIR